MATQESIPETDDGIKDLRSAWKEMFQKKLPEAASSKSPVQPKWPVHVDHCFARILLDATVGIDAPWMAKVKSPAYKHMTRPQLEASILLGEKILSGEADLLELDNKSLTLRGKTKSGKMSKEEIKDIIDKEQSKKRKNGDKDAEAPPAPKKPRTAEREADAVPKADSKPPHAQSLTEQEKASLLSKIAHSPTSTPFQKRVLSALLQVPRGHYTTYGILAKHLSSSARAVGNGLRRNPFAPEVPCHRVLAAGGGIGGFKGSWGRNGNEGLNDGEKRGLLREEGVRFDGRGRVVGRPWEGFK